MKNVTTLGLLLPGFMVLSAGLAQATTIPGTIPNTLTIMTDSHLTTNVSCTVTNAPCIKFGAPGITLKLNGFTMTGNVPPPAGCSGNTAENGIDTSGLNNVTVQGPGLVTLFNGDGIVVSGKNSSVEGVAVNFICSTGIRVLGSKNEVEGNSVGAASFLGGNAEIIVAGSGGAQDSPQCSWWSKFRNHRVGNK